MKFKITFEKNNFGRIVAIAVIVFSVFGGLMRRDLTAIVIGLTAIALIIVAMTRFYVVVTDEMLEARNFFTTQRIRWTDIHEVKTLKRFGLELHEFISKNNIVKIYFSLFSKACYDEVFKRLPAI